MLNKGRKKNKNIREHILIYWKRLERYLNGDKIKQVSKYNKTLVKSSKIALNLYNALNLAVFLRFFHTFIHTSHFHPCSLLSVLLRKISPISRREKEFAHRSCHCCCTGSSTFPKKHDCLQITLFYELSTSKKNYTHKRGFIKTVKNQNSIIAN